MKNIRRYLVIPAVLCGMVGIALMFVRALGIGGIVAGGLLFDAAVVFMIIGAGTPPRYVLRT